MGGNSSKSSVQQTNEFFNKTTNSFVSENSQKVSASALNLNKLNFQRATFKGCRVAINQSIDSDVIATGEMSTQNIQDLTAKLKNDASTAIDNAASQKSGFLSPTVGNSSTATTNLKTTVTNIIENTMSSKSVQDIFASAKNKNDGDFSDLYYECDPAYKTPGKCSASQPDGCDFVVDQNIKSKVVAKGVADAITKALASTIADNTVAAEVKQSSKQESAGVAELVSAITGPYAMICIAIVVLLCVVCGGIVYFMSSPAGQAATMKAANAGAAYAGKH